MKKISVGKHVQPLYKGLGPLSPLIASFLTMAAYLYDGKLRGVFISHSKHFRYSVFLVCSIIPTRHHRNTIFSTRKDDMTTISSAPHSYKRSSYCGTTATLYPKDV